MCGYRLSTGRTRRKGGGCDTSLAAGAPVLVLHADPTRVALIMSTSGNGIQVFPFSDANSTNGSFKLTLNNTPLIFDVETFGDLVTGEIWAAALTTPGRIQILAIVDTDYQDGKPDQRAGHYPVGG